MALYLILSSEWGQSKIKSEGESQLSHLLGTEVRIGTLNFSPFNRLEIKDVRIKDDNDSTALIIRNIDTRYEMWDLLFSQKIIVDYATIYGLDLHIYRDSLNAPTNINNILKRLIKNEPKKEPSLFKLRINDIDIQDSGFSYDVLSEPETPDRFNKSHIQLTDLTIDAFAPVLSNDNYIFSIRTISFIERSGFGLKDLSFLARLNQQKIIVEDLNVKFGNSCLDFADISSPIDSIKSLTSIGTKYPLNISLDDGSHIYLPDLKPFIPILGELEYLVDINLDITGIRDSIEVSTLTLKDNYNAFALNLEGDFKDLSSFPAISFKDVNFNFQSDSTIIGRVISNPSIKLSEKARDILLALGNTNLECKSDGSFEKGTVSLNCNSNLANVDLKGSYYYNKDSKQSKFDSKIILDKADLGTLLSNHDFDKMSAIFDIRGEVFPKQYNLELSSEIGYLYFKDAKYEDIQIHAGANTSGMDINLAVNDNNIKLEGGGMWQKEGDISYLIGSVNVEKLSLDSLEISQKYDDYILQGKIEIDASGYSWDKCKAKINIDNLTFMDSEGKGITMNNFDLLADNLKHNGSIDITSDYINGQLDGSYNFSTLVPEALEIVQQFIPAVVNSNKNNEDKEKKLKFPDTSNDFVFEFALSHCEELCEFFDFPVTIIDESTLNGVFSHEKGRFFFNADIPWIQQGSNIIEDTALAIAMDTEVNKGIGYITSYIPTKKGDMELVTTIDASDGQIDTKIDWSLIRAIPINGTIDFTTILSRDMNDKLITQVNFNPGDINFGDEIWSIQPSTITYYGNTVNVNNFALITPSQIIAINGKAGPDAEDEMIIELRNIQLINIFETLEIDKALISGYATGDISARALFSKTPLISCEHLAVKSIGYNYCTLGDADVKLSVDDGGKMIKFDADVIGETGLHSYIDGYIEPATEGLEINIKADKVKVGFMKPFMEAFTSEVEGYASGTAKLYGTFKYIDMTGDIYAQDLKIKIDFTNTWYHTSDSIHIRPGIIDLKDITIYDDYGHTAKLNGWVGHNFFHDATFDFNITEAHDFLSYDVTEKLSPDWYGRIFGNGSASVKGKPGVVDIGANMSTATNSTFTFVLSDTEEASEYSFITFRDATPKPELDSIIGKSTVPDRVMEAKRNRFQSNEDAPTAYNMDINIDINPQAQVIIVMDPIGGDRIKAYGEGHMRMTYGSIDNDLRLYGTYTLERGSYNFTLQDIIVKDFTIKEGSNITFLGDPYAAHLDIDAYYQVQANLSDLDESFLQDKDLNRTNVPVRALLEVTGDMRQPDITFDLEFPTLTQDIYRKVKSIVSTEDMMNRQIIYLLALNRFYTPEYMASTTKGNELFSVASSTISSQLSSMLGKLSENWSIAPNLRSDRGDFTDLEVDLTLSSSLLNNRLLFNGNFGYRDKALNSNQFVGDFDIEYLLNKSGEWRLKAYNRYNDQNYYLRTAQTTQGVGIVYRRDFDKTLRFLKHLRPKKKDKKEIPAIDNNNKIDTVEIQEDINVEEIINKDIDWIQIKEKTDTINTSN